MSASEDDRAQYPDPKGLISVTLVQSSQGYCFGAAVSYTARHTWVFCGMVYIPLEQKSSTFLSPRTGFMEDSFSMDQGWRGMVLG